MPDRLNEIRARLDAATPGPWWTAEQRRPYSNPIWSRSDDPVTTGETIGSIYLQPDADLIAHAPADIAWLLDEVKRWKHVAENDLYGVCWCDAPRPDCCECPGGRGDVHRGDVRA